MAAVSIGPDPGMKIGELARRCDVNIDTIRYYERQGLLPEPDRLASGYRRYQGADIERLRFVRRAKALGFMLDEIKELLAISDHREEDMAELKAAATAKLADIETRLVELTRIRDGLHTLVDACPGEGALAQCPILNALRAMSHERQAEAKPFEKRRRTHRLSIKRIGC